MTSVMGRGPSGRRCQSASGRAWFLTSAPATAVQLLSRVRLSSTPWTAARQASLSITNSQSLLKLMSMSRRCHPTISTSVVPFSSCPRSFPASGAFQMSQLFTSGGQSTGASYSASVLPVNATEPRGQFSCPSFGLRDSWRSSEAPCFRRIAVVRPGDRLLRGPWGW